MTLVNYACLRPRCLRIDASGRPSRAVRRAKSEGALDVCMGRGEALTEGAPAGGRGTLEGRGEGGGGEGGLRPPRRVPSRNLKIEMGPRQENPPGSARGAKPGR